MEITFTPGLSESKGKEGKEETTLEKYQRKMKEKKKRRKEEGKEKEKVQKGIEDDFFAADESTDDENGGEDDNEGSPSRETHSTAEELALLAASDNPSGEPKHFDMKAVLKAEKSKGKRRNRVRVKKGEVQDFELQEDFSIDVKDERFKALHEDHTFAIDPSNPHFKKTKGMSALLEERAKRQREKRLDSGITAPASESNSISQSNLKNLVESVKRKSTAAEGGFGKRRKL